MKIKLIKDIPGYKAGEVLEFEKLGLERTDSRKACYPDYRADILITDGFAEEVKDEIDIEEIRNELYAVRNLRTADNFSHSELEFFTSYRIVKAVIEKLNGDWEYKHIHEGRDYYHKDHWSIILRDSEFKADNYLNWSLSSILPVIKDNQTAEKVISLCEPELKVLFGVK